MTNGQTPQAYFRVILLTVVGQAFTTAGYELEETPIQWAGGRFRFRKSLESGLNAFLEYQLLAYTDTEWSSGTSSRFRVTVTRTDQINPTLESSHGDFAQRDLGTLIVEDFGVQILPAGDYWWRFRNTDELAKALAEAGHLAIGYAMPWLAGELQSPNSG